MGEWRFEPGDFESVVGHHREDADYCAHVANIKLDKWLREAPRVHGIKSLESGTKTGVTVWTEVIPKYEAELTGRIVDIKPAEKEG